MMVAVDADPDFIAAQFKNAFYGPDLDIRERTGSRMVRGLRRRAPQLRGQAGTIPCAFN